MSLKPHHVFCMKPPTLFLQSFRRQVLTLGTFHVIKYKKQCFRRKTLEEFYSIRMRKLYLREKILQTSNFVIPPRPSLSLFYTPVDSKVAWDTNFLANTTLSVRNQRDEAYDNKQLPSFETVTGVPFARVPGPVVLRRVKVECVLPKWRCYYC